MVSPIERRQFSTSASSRSRSNIEVPCQLCGVLAGVMAMSGSEKLKVALSCKSC
jgi:hypothetical protein